MASATTIRRTRWWNIHPSHGLRISVFDVVYLLLGIFIAWAGYRYAGPFAFLPIVVLAHFFLFCNVFRIHRKLELTWAAVFLVNFGTWTLFASLDWVKIFAIQTPITIALIVYEILQPRYHGIGLRHKP